MSVQGVKAIAAALKAHSGKCGRGVERGLKRAGLFLQREAQKVVPIDTTTLKNSANTRPEGKGFDTAVVVSFSTDYAVYVHENLEAKHKPGKSAKYLERPLREKRDRMGEIVRQAMRETL